MRQVKRCRSDSYRIVFCIEVKQYNVCTKGVSVASSLYMCYKKRGVLVGGVKYPV